MIDVKYVQRLQKGVETQIEAMLGPSEADYVVQLFFPKCAIEKDVDIRWPLLEMIFGWVMLKRGISALPWFGTLRQSNMALKNHLFARDFLNKTFIYRGFGS